MHNSVVSLGLFVFFGVFCLVFCVLLLFLCFVFVVFLFVCFFNGLLCLFGFLAFFFFFSEHKPAANVIYGEQSDLLNLPGYLTQFA